MLQNKISGLVLFAGLFLSISTLAQEKHHPFVDPMIGSEGLGRVFIGPSYPFGMVKPSPDCTSSPNSGWLPQPVPVTGFSQLHVSGTGGGPKYGNILVMPFTGALNQTDQSSPRENEKVKLGYYSVILKKSMVKTEITTANRASFYKFTYPFSKDKSLKIDPGFFLGEQPIPDSREAQQFVGSEIEMVSPTEIKGYSRIRGGWNNGRAYTVYFYAILDQPVESFTSWKGTKLYPGKAFQFDSGEKTGVLMAIGGKGQEVNMKIGISFLSSLKAKANVDQEIPDWDFARVLTDLEDKWEQLFSRLDIDNNSTVDQKKMFYTGLYHTMLMPVNRTGENPLWTNDQPYYDDFYTLWDTFRTSNPLITLISPKQEVEIVNSLINIYKREGYMPDGRSGNANGRTQGGSHGEALIADAYVKGLEGIDYQAGLEAMLKDATVAPGGNEEQEGRGGLTEYNRLGYVPYEIPRSGNRTVDYAYNDFNIATVAKGLNQQKIYERFNKQAGNWKNLWRDSYTNNGSKGFIMPKNAEGKWLDIVPYGNSERQHPTFIYTPLTHETPWYMCHWCGFFYEGTSWEYSFSIPHAIPEIISKTGGNEAFKKRLDTFFDKGFYNVDNEASFLIPTLYHWIGRPDLSTERIRKIVSKSFNTSANGLPGNDDSGAMSSWLVFHMMGLYPNAGQSYYLLNSPMLKQIILHQENGNDFKIIANGLSATNIFIKYAKLNGKDYNKAWITHEDILKGGELIFEMDVKPSGWGINIMPPLANN